MTPEVKERIARGTTRYAGEWHLSACADESQGMWCEDNCSVERTDLKRLGVPVDCPDGQSWGQWGDALMGVTNG